MRFSHCRFSVPDQIFDDDLTDKEFRLLAFLFKSSSVDGCTSPGYAAMMQAINTECRNTINFNLKSLRKKDWFHFVKRRGHLPTMFWLKIPARLLIGKELSRSVIEEMNPQYRISR